MSYIVEYRNVSDIIDSYYVDFLPVNEKNVYECVLVQGTYNIAKFIETKIPQLVFGEPQELLKQLVRCYIIDIDNLPSSLIISEIFNRYR